MRNLRGVKNFDMIEIKKSKNAFDKAALVNLETEYGFKFPQEYIEFLRTYNGGRPEGNIVKLPECEIESFLIDTFFGVNQDNNNNIVHQFRTLQGRIPKECIPIAYVEGGNVICMNLSSQKYGYIYLWDHELELAYGEAITVDNMYFIAETFTKFLKMIEKHNPQNTDLSGYKVISVKILDPEFYEKVKQEQNKK